MSFIERRKIIREDVATRQIHEEHVADYQILRRHVATGQVYEEHVADKQVKSRHVDDYQVLRRHVATWQVYSEHVQGVQMLGVGPVPDTPTVYAYPRALPDVPRIRSVTPTTAGVIGYVLIAGISATTITLRGNVSGVYCDVILMV